MSTGVYRLMDEYCRRGHYTWRSFQRRFILPDYVDKHVIKNSCICNTIIPRSNKSPGKKYLLHESWIMPWYWNHDMYSRIYRLFVSFISLVIQDASIVIGKENVSLSCDLSRKIHCVLLWNVPELRNGLMLLNYPYPSGLTPWKVKLHLNGNKANQTTTKRNLCPYWLGGSV